MNILACGALANELIALKRLNHWHRLNITCLPAHYHQTPHKIPAAVARAIAKIRQKNTDEILVAYGDCGTGGKLDKVLKAAGVERLPGAHCYEFFAGHDVFFAMHDAEPGTFYLTDFLVDHFETYVWRMLGLDRKPELLNMYFGNYSKLLYLGQAASHTRRTQAMKYAARLGLAYEYLDTGYGEMERGITVMLQKQKTQQRQQKVAIPCLN